MLIKHKSKNTETLKIKTQKNKKLYAHANDAQNTIP